MTWTEVQQAYPEQWLVIEALDAHSTGNRRYLDRIAVIETCPDGKAAMTCYRALHQQYPMREFYFVHSSRKALEIEEARSVTRRRDHASPVHA